jgi:hypothetical protein
MENKEYTARKIKSAFNKIEKSGKRVTTTNICKLLGHPHLTDDEKRLVEIERKQRKWKEQAREERKEPIPVEIKIEIKWVRSKTWGNNSNGTARVIEENGNIKYFSYRCSGCGYDKRTECVAGLLDQCTRGLMWRSKSTIGFRRQKDMFVSWKRSGLERVFEQFKKWGYKVEHTDLERFDLIYIYKNMKKK